MMDQFRQSMDCDWQRKEDKDQYWEQDKEEETAEEVNVLQCFFSLLSNGSGLNSEASACSPAPLRLPQTSGRPLWFTAPMPWTWLNLSSQENKHIPQSLSRSLSPLFPLSLLSIFSSNIDIRWYLLLTCSFETSAYRPPPSPCHLFSLYTCWAPQ